MADSIDLTNIDPDRVRFVGRGWVVKDSIPPGEIWEINDKLYVNSLDELPKVGEELVITHRKKNKSNV